MKTVLITGCSSGFGEETAKYFLEQGWKVVATMRNPDDSKLPKSLNLRVLALDVTKIESIKKVVADAGAVDVLVNNAGLGMLNALEGVTVEQIRTLFETNVIGAMAMIQAMLPQMREKRSGVIVNVTSTVTSHPLPLLSVYTASKAALNAFTECLQLELESFGIQVRNVLPGRAPSTKFVENARDSMVAFPEPYMPLVQKVMAAFQAPSAQVTHASDVAQAVFKVAIDPASAPMRFPAGVDAIEAETNRRAF